MAYIPVPVGEHYVPRFHCIVGTVQSYSTVEHLDMHMYSHVYDRCLTCTCIGGNSIDVTVVSHIGLCRGTTAAMYMYMHMHKWVHMYMYMYTLHHCSLTTNLHRFEGIEGSRGSHACTRHRSVPDGPRPSIAQNLPHVAWHNLLSSCQP